MFIGRERELAFLEECYKKPEGQLVILYGRRRIGKTELLLEFAKNKQAVFYSCIECPDRQQLEAISLRMLQQNNPAAKYLTVFPDWAMLFENLEQLAAAQQKALLIIDEFPYMVKSNTSIPSVLQMVWDRKLKNANVMIILCGSAMSFMEKEILEEKNPLYGRATGILKLQEMNYREVAQFVNGYSARDKMTVYSITGGVPYYVKQFDTSLSLKENVIKNILTPGGILYSEVDFLLRQELRETGTYNAIIQAVALGNTKLNDIFQKTQIEKTKLSAYLKNLTELGIIWKEFPIDTKIKETANVNRGLYKLTDNYFAFWYAYVYPNLSELEAGDAAGIWNYVVEPSLDAYVSYSFEKVCWQYLRQKNQREELPFHFIKIGHWWDKTDEIDIVAVDREEKNVLVGECKYRKELIDMGVLQKLQKKIEKSDKALYYYLFSKSGFTEELQVYAQNNAVILVTLENMFLDSGNPKEM